MHISNSALKNAIADFSHTICVAHLHHPSHLPLRQLGTDNEDTGETDEQWSGDYIFENEWQSFRTKKDRSLELTSTAHECTPGPRKIAVKVVDVFGNDTMKILEVNV